VDHSVWIIQHHKDRHTTAALKLDQHHGLVLVPRQPCRSGVNGPEMLYKISKTEPEIQLRLGETCLY
jgi:hypothetical protein